MASTVDKRRVREFSDDLEYLDDKIKTLARMITTSNRTVFFTGAGVSTSAGISDYRGPTGCWTKSAVRKLQNLKKRSTEQSQQLKLLMDESAKKQIIPEVKKIDATPTPCHMAMATLIRLGHAKHVVTTNLDGLHRKSGLRHHKELTCLHGDIYIERCTKCGHEEERSYNVRARKGGLNVHDHSIGTCQRCRSKPPKRYTGKKGPKDDRRGMVGPEDKNCGTKDTHINFGESLDDIDWDEAERVCDKADLCIVVGTSMSLRHVTHFPFMARKTVIINLQKTPDDDDAHLRLWGKADDVFLRLMELLQIQIDPIPASALPCSSRKPVTPVTNMEVDVAKKETILPKLSSKGPEKVVLEMAPVTVGVTVKGRTVVKVTPGSQAKKAGVLVGWEILKVGGAIVTHITSKGQVAADAITRTLASRKKQGHQYEIEFGIPPSIHVPAPSTSKVFSTPIAPKSPPPPVDSLPTPPRAAPMTPPRTPSIQLKPVAPKAKEPSDGKVGIDNARLGPRAPGVPRFAAALRSVAAMARSGCELESA